MSSALKKSSIGTAVCSLAFVCFLFVPIPGLTPTQFESDVVKGIEERGSRHFAMIQEGQNLDRPFPPMPMRPDNAMSEA
jgi:hypothetical protein